MKLNRITDYSIVVLAVMARKDKRMSTSELSAYTMIPEPTVSKLLKLLAKSSIVKSIRGASGGYILLKSEDEITANDIIIAMEGPVALTSCVAGSNEKSCAAKKLCPLSNGWQKLNDSITDALSSVTLRELVSYEALDK